MESIATRWYATPTTAGIFGYHSIASQDVIPLTGFYEIHGRRPRGPLIGRTHQGSDVISQSTG